MQTPQQFYDWFTLIDRSVAHSQEAHYRAHVASVSEHLDTCDLLINRIDDVEKEVDDMLEGWKGVEESGKSLKDACESLLEERVRQKITSIYIALTVSIQDGLIELIDDIGGHLEYFRELEQATRMLNHPGESLIFEADFLYMVERVDICIDFLKGHVKNVSLSSWFTRTHSLSSATFQGSGSLPLEVPTVHDSCHDANKNEFRWFSQSSLVRSYEASI